MGFIKLTKMNKNKIIRVNTDNILFYEPITYENGKTIGSQVWFTSKDYIEIEEVPDEIDRLIENVTILKETDNP